MSFNANDHEDTTPDFSPVPAGEYTLAMVKVERKESNTAGNYYQNCQFKIIGGKHKGRIVFHMFHLENSEAAMDIAKGQLSSMMKSMGVNVLEDVWNFEPLMSKPFTAKLKATTDPNGVYDPKNEIAKFIVGGSPTSGIERADELAHADEPWATGNTEGKKKKKKKKDKATEPPVDVPEDKKKKKKKKKD